MSKQTMQQDPLAILSKAVTCPFCHIQFGPVVKFIPDCGKLVCGQCFDHLVESSEESNEFQCTACGNQHVLPESGLRDFTVFPDVRDFLIEKPLSEQGNILKLLVENVQEELAKLDSFNLREHLEQHCELLTIEVEDSADSAAKDFNEIRSNLLKEIVENRQLCLDQLAATQYPLPSDEATKGSRSSTKTELVQEIRDFSSKWSDNFNRLDFLPTDDQLDSALDQADAFQARIKALDQEMLNSVLNQTLIKFEHEYLNKQDNESMASPPRPEQISSHLTERPLSAKASELKLQIEEVRQKIAKLEPFHPRDQIENHCAQLELEVEGASDKAVKQVNETKNNLLTVISENRQQSLDIWAANPHSSRTFPEARAIAMAEMEHKALSKMIPDFVDKWTSGYFKLLNSMASESELKEAIGQANDFQAHIKRVDHDLRNNALGHTLAQLNTRGSFPISNHRGQLIKPFAKQETSKDLRIDEGRVAPIMLKNGSSRIEQITFLPDGRLASCSRDHTIKVWDLASGRDEELFTLRGHTREVYSLAMLLDGTLASGSRDHTIKLWDLDARQAVRTLSGHQHSIVSLKLLSNGNLVSFDTYNTINIWNPYLRENNLLLTMNLRTNSGYPWNPFFGPFGVLSSNCLVTCLGEGENANIDECIVKVWNPTDGKLIMRLPTKLLNVSLVLVLSNDQIAIGTEDGTIKIIDLQDPANNRVSEKCHRKITSLFQLSNSNLVGSACRNEDWSTSFEIKIWHWLTLSVIQEFKIHLSDIICSLSVSADETMLAIGSWDETISVWPIVVKSEAKSESE